ncbi:MAG: DUF971 domain-containing protein [Planctomycetes bacterium]|nr:DUF971 domain-containing protein [Planctomycetota bacterium]
MSITQGGRPLPLRIERQEGRRIAVEWRDAHRSLYPMRHLRGRCPCANCVDEGSGKRRYFEADAPEDLGFSDVWLVGNYALGIRFSDGHETGIFTYDYLRSICPCPACSEPAGGADQKVQPKVPTSDQGGGVG